jgi:2-polyprenyl-6-methoxyphenol hydroxylase-like FAD-dependent oxidoreductase
MIDMRFRWKVKYVEVKEDNVSTRATMLKTGESRVFVSGFAVGCDNASNAVRRSLETPRNGGASCVSLGWFCYVRPFRRGLITCHVHTPKCRKCSAPA